MSDVKKEFFENEDAQLNEYATTTTVSRQKISTWINTHKKQLIITGITAFGAVLIVTNRDSLRELLKTTKSDIPDIEKAKTLAEKVHTPIIPKDILDNLTGNMLTATALGDKVGCSAQVINKRLVAAKLAEKLPNGEYMVTDVGRKLGKQTSKTTFTGHPFSNLEWDEKVLEIIFSPEELRDIATKQEHIRQILAS